MGFFSGGKRMQALPRQLSKDVLHTLICTDSHPPAGIRVPATSSVVPPPVPPPHTCRRAALSGFATPRSFFPRRVTLSPAFRAGTHVLVVSFLTSPPSLSHLLPDEYVLRCQLKKEKKKGFVSDIVSFSVGGGDRLNPLVILLALRLQPR